LPSGEYATESTSFECPLSVHTGSPPPACCAMCVTTPRRKIPPLAASPFQAVEDVEIKNEKGKPNRED
jgi:hypothetical protein